MALSLLKSTGPPFQVPSINIFMKIFELVGVKKYQDMTEYEFSQMMTQNGFDHIGSGSHAQVFRRGNDPFVYRVTSNDGPYEAYAEYAMKTPNIHYPKIYGIKNLSNFFKRTIENRWSRFNVVKVEYVPYPMSVQEFTEFDRAWRSLYMDQGHGLRSESDPQGKWLSLVKAYYEIFDAIQTGVVDMHRANFGKRVDGSFVILDPAWEGESPYQAYDRMMRDETDWHGDYDDDPEYVSGAWNQKREKERYPPYVPLPQTDDDIPF